MHSNKNVFRIKVALGLYYARLLLCPEFQAKKLILDLIARYTRHFYRWCQMLFLKPFSWEYLELLKAISVSTKFMKSAKASEKIYWNVAH